MRWTSNSSSRGRRKSRNSLTVRSGEGIVTPASELERRVQALKETVVAEVRLNDSFYFLGEASIMLTAY